MKPTKRVITIRVRDDVYDAFRKKSKTNKRSMSQQGELLIEEFVGELIQISDSSPTSLSDIIRGKMETNERSRS